MGVVLAPENAHPLLGVNIGKCDVGISLHHWRTGMRRLRLSRTRSPLPTRAAAEPFLMCWWPADAVGEPKGIFLLGWISETLALPVNYTRLRGIIAALDGPRWACAGFAKACRPTHVIDRSEGGSTVGLKSSQPEGERATGARPQR